MRVLPCTPSDQELDKQMVLMAQSVPTASAVPCMRAELDDWFLDDLDSWDGSTRIEFSRLIDQVALTIYLTRTCDGGGASETATDQPGTRRFDQDHHRNGHHGQQAAAVARTVGGRRMDQPGRSCPLAYRYRPEGLAQPPQLEADAVFVVGGLYGNPAALQAVLERADRERGPPPAIVFNGDAHWLDVDREDFQTISEAVLAHHAIKGNVEAELASDTDAGCGCGYPDYVGDDVVDRSNQIMTQLRATASRFPEQVGRLGALPRFLTAAVAGERVGILHGDPESLAGWRLALEAMEPGDPSVRRQVGWRGQPTTPADLLNWFDRADVSVFASTHTGLPYAQAVADGRRRRLVINNGAAGLANFAGTTHGVITRLSSDPEPPADSLYGTTVGSLRCDALPVRFDLERWKERFLAQWPPGSHGHRSYFARITRGTDLRLQQAARVGVQPAAHREQP